jgi:hypothetical protein
VMVASTAIRQPRKPGRGVAISVGALNERGRGE